MPFRIPIFRSARAKPGSYLSDRVDWVTVANVAGDDIHSPDAPAVLLVGDIFGRAPSLTPLDFRTLRGRAGARPGPNLAGSDDTAWIELLKRAAGGKAPP